MALIGVTGTNGKTTCTQLIAQAFELLGTRCGVVGTLGWGFPGTPRCDHAHHPRRRQLQQMLAGLRAGGATAAALEVSSHALKQGRVRGLRFATAIFTNLTHDHLDYHGSFEDYGASKQMLFASERLSSCAVVNSDDPFGRRLLDALPRGVDALSYGVGARFRRAGARDRSAVQRRRLAAQVVTPWGRGTLQRTPLLGHFNLHNALAALSVLCLHGVAFDDALAVFPRLSPVAGRMERIARRRGPLVIVDYAHTPDALEQTLRALRQCTAPDGCGACSAAAAIATAPSGR
jgi:UDP-N-acetylmuramoyl-L-alanyl-D-glutamate--2,6-diaminopimelate ligase